MGNTAALLALCIMIITNGCMGEEETRMKENTYFQPDQVWYDTAGDPIRANGGCILERNGMYYWYGERRSQFNHFTGIGCYMSRDLLNWENMGVALEPSENSGDATYKTNILERPKVVYNEKNNNYVMWLHAEGNDYSSAKVCVAVSDSPTGLFQELDSMQPNGIESRDMTVFVDDDKTAYLISATDNNASLGVHELNEDYTGFTGKFTRILENEHNEAPAVFKKNGTYYMITSGCTGFPPNPLRVSQSDSIMEGWKTTHYLSRGYGKESSFHSQSAFVLPTGRQDIEFILLADHWRSYALETSTQVWLPLEWEENGWYTNWYDKWNFSECISGKGYQEDLSDTKRLEIPYGDPVKLVSLKTEKSNGDFYAGWTEKGITIRARIYGQDLSNNQLDDDGLYKSNFTAWINYFEIVTGINDTGKELTKIRTQIDPSEVYEYTTEISPEENGDVWYTIVVKDSKFFNRPVSEGLEFGMTLLGYVDSIKQYELTYPKDFSWRDVSTYYRAVLVK